MLVPAKEGNQLVLRFTLEVNVRVCFRVYKVEDIHAYTQTIQGKSMPGGEYKEMSNRFLALKYPGV